MQKGFAVVLFNLCATWFLLGLIWVVQLVHYPLFAKVGAAGWDAYHRDHMRTITVIVAPLMFVEAISAAILIFVVRNQAHAVKVCVWVGAVLVLVNWFATAGVAVPLHNKLGIQFDPAAISSLVSTNWIRTIAWTVRGGLMAYITWRMATSIRPVSA